PGTSSARASSYSCLYVLPFGLSVPERNPPRRPDDRSLRERRELLRASPERARSLLTVRAAISSARLSEAPLRRSLCLMCSYCRALFVPFFTPRGGTATTTLRATARRCRLRRARSARGGRARSRR